MIPLRPRLRVDSGVQATTRPPSSYATVAPPETPVYPHTSVFRSLQMELHINSPNVKVIQEAGGQRSLPVFGDHDRVHGQVLLDPSCSSGRLKISVEGIFSYTSSNAETFEGPSTSPSSAKQEVTFFSSSIVLPVSPGHDSGSPRSTFRVRVRRPSITKKSSLPNLNSPVGPAPKPFPFNFEIPRGSRPGEEFPPTFTSSMVVESGPRGRAFAEGAEVAYKVTTLWEPTDSEGSRVVLEAPIMFHPDSDFQSLDGLQQEPDAWLEMPLRSDRPIPVQCAVTLPSPGVFSRRHAIPYFVVFTTTPRSSARVREIASDATIAVSLLRQVTVSTPLAGPLTPPQTPSDSDESDNPLSATSGAMKSHRKLLKRMMRSARSQEPLATGDAYASPKDKPLPQLPMATFSDSRTLQTDVCIGFPKRPRHRGTSPQGHPSLESYTSLPDGLLKGKVQLNKTMLPGIDWPGVSVKYYLDVSVLFGQDDLRARIPIRIV